MKQQDLIDYLKKVYSLECSLYGQHQLFIKLSQRAKQLASPPLISYKALEKGSSPSGDEAIAYLGGGAAVGWILGFATLFIGLYDGLEKFLKPTGMGPCLWGTILGFFIGSFLFFKSIMQESASTDRKNKQITAENNRIKEKNSATLASAKAERKILLQELTFLRTSIAETKQVLDTYYAQNVIYNKKSYRSLIGVSSFLDYLLSGRCSSLEGHEGAYNKFDDESLHKIIISKLDDILTHLDRIEQNQQFLFSAIQESNQNINRIRSEIASTAQSIQSIEQSSAIAAYNSHVCARNTEAIKWIEFLR